MKPLEQAAAFTIIVCLMVMAVAGTVKLIQVMF